MGRGANARATQNTFIARIKPTSNAGQLSPATNLDAAGIAWYQEQVTRLKENRIVVVCSNAEAEYGFCDNQIYIQDYQKKKA